MDVALNKSQIEQIAGKPVNVISYKNLDKVKDINHLFFDLGSKDKICEMRDGCLIHFQTAHKGKSLMGHWCILVSKGNDIYFFDSYGDYIDDQLNNIDSSYNKRVNQDYPTLSKLLSEAPQKIHYNPYQLQSMDNGSATCGRYCALFLKYFENYKNMDDFAKELMEFKKKGYCLDQLVTDLTDKLAGKKLS